MNFFDLKKKQNKDYKHSKGLRKFRCNKLDVTDNPELGPFLDFLLPIFNFFSRKIHRDIKSGRLEQKAPRLMADGVYLGEVEYLESKYGFKKTFIKRGIIRPILQKYESYCKRNKDSGRTYPDHPIIFENIFKRKKGFHLYDGSVTFDHENKELKINCFGSKSEKNLRLGYKCIGTMDRTEHLIKKNPGGNFKVERGRVYFVTRVERPYTWAYQLEGFLGFDINKTRDHFIKFSDPIAFQGKKTDVISKKSRLFKRINRQEKLLEGVRKKLHDDSVLKKKIVKKRQLGEPVDELVAQRINRHHYHNKLHRHHKILKRLYMLVAREIVDFCRDNKLCLCIDEVATGAKSGSYGQDKLRANLVTLCEDLCVPHVQVPSPYTTRECYLCGFINPKVPLSVREFDCENCEEHLLRDGNAATVVRDRGRRIWEVGLEEYSKEFSERTGKKLNKK